MEADRTQSHLDMVVNITTGLFAPIAYMVHTMHYTCVESCSFQLPTLKTYSHLLSFRFHLERSAYSVLRRVCKIVSIIFKLQNDE